MLKHYEPTKVIGLAYKNAYGYVIPDGLRHLRNFAKKRRNVDFMR
jgi:hypothetical protein